MKTSRNRALAILLSPGAIWVFTLYVVPLLLIALYSVLTKQIGGGVTWTFSAAAYQKLFAADPDVLLLNNFVVVLLRTIGWGLLTVGICLLIGYPLAFYIAQRSPATRGLLIMLVIIPFWTNLLVRIYAWKFILSNNGLINTLLQALGFSRVPMINTPGAVILGLVYISLPFMILPLYASIERFDHAYVEAAQDLGAGYLKTFLRIVLPMTLPGVMAGGLLVFIVAIGQYIVPVVLGGGKVMMLGNLLGLQFSQAFDWPFGSAIAVLFIVLMMAGVAHYIRSEKRGSAA